MTGDRKFSGSPAHASQKYSAEPWMTRSSSSISPDQGERADELFVLSINTREMVKPTGHRPRSSDQTENTERKKVLITMRKPSG